VCNHLLKCCLPGLVTARCLPGIKIREAVRKVEMDKEEQSHSVQPHEGEAASVLPASMWSPGSDWGAGRRESKRGKLERQCLGQRKIRPCYGWQESEELLWTCLPAGAGRHDFLCLCVEAAEMRNARGTASEPGGLLAGQSVWNTAWYRHTHSPGTSPSPTAKTTSACICPRARLRSRPRCLPGASLRGRFERSHRSPGACISINRRESRESQQGF